MHTVPYLPLGLIRHRNSHTLCHIPKTEVLVSILGIKANRILTSSICKPLISDTSEHLYVHVHLHVHVNRTCTGISFTGRFDSAPVETNIQKQAT